MNSSKYLNGYDMNKNMTNTERMYTAAMLDSLQVGTISFETMRLRLITHNIEKCGNHIRLNIWMIITFIRVL